MSGYASTYSSITAAIRLNSSFEFPVVHIGSDIKSRFPKDLNNVIDSVFRLIGIEYFILSDLDPQPPALILRWMNRKCLFTEIEAKRDNFSLSVGDCLRFYPLSVKVFCQAFEQGVRRDVPHHFPSQIATYPKKPEIADADDAVGRRPSLSFSRGVFHDEIPVAEHPPSSVATALAPRQANLDREAPLRKSGPLDRSSH